MKPTLTNEETTSSTATLPASVNPKQETETLLLVDDNECDRDLMGMVLRDAGYKVLEADGGLSGLDIFAAQPTGIALILTDILMPGMDGVEFIEAVRKVVPKQKVIFMSGHKRSFSQDEHDFVEKSVNLLPLVQRVREVLEEKGTFARFLKKVQTNFAALAF